MYGYQYYRESYYPHRCLIVPEKDVLDTDIEGTDIFTRFQRWWQDLFLLSYSSHMTSNKTYFNSFHEMLIERYRQYRKYRSRIHPMSKFRDFWEFLILHVVIMKQIIFRFTSTFLFDELPLGLFYFGAFLELIIAWDLYISLKTGYANKETRQIILEPKMCLMKFCTTNLFMHFAAAIPLHWFMFLRYGSNIACGLCKTNRFNCALKIISVFGLLRIYDASNYWVKKRSRIFLYKFVRLATIGFVTMCQFYDLSDVFCLLVFMNNGYVHKNSTLGIRSGFKYGGIDGQVDYPNYKFVFFDISRVFKSLLLFSFGIRGKIYYVDKVVSLLAFLLANGFFAWSVLVAYSLVSRHTYPNDTLIRKRHCAFNLLASRQLSDTLRARVGMYYDYKHTKAYTTETTNELYRCLPRVLQREAKISCYMKHIMHIPLFSEWPISVLEEVVLMLKKEVYLPNDIVSEAFEQGDGLMIVDSGVLAVYSPEYEEVGHLIDGDYFGEVSLVTEKELYMSFVVAVTPCTILVLEKARFRMFMRGFPQLFYDTKTRLKEKYNSNIVTIEENEDEASASKRTIKS